MCQRLCLYLLLAAALLPPVSAASPVEDYRIVIDVSGSMQLNDPQNLRVPAVQLFAGLLPDGSRAGIWTFGRYVDAVVKWDRVDDAWRRRADAGAAGIHANADLTNIESALARAALGWDRADANSRRILLLLTDGRVEVSADPAKNAQSRRRVLEHNLPALKAAGAEVHAIALTRATDEALLQRLAFETGGSFAVAETAGGLARAFAQAFERAHRPQTVAFDGNEFTLDSDIERMTLLLFRPPGAEAAMLIPPDSPAISAGKTRGARWQSGTGFDLVTVDRPGIGKWRVVGEMDPDDRLMVTTGLRLQPIPLPARIDPRDGLTIAAELFRDGRKISRNSYLRFVDFSLTHVAPDGSSDTRAMSHTPVREDKGRYLLTLEPGLAEGRHSFVVAADGPGYNRSLHFDLAVRSPVEVVIEPRTRAGDYELRLRAREQFLEADGLAARVTLEAPDGERRTLVAEAAGGWLRAPIETDQDGPYRARIEVSAKNHAGETGDIDLGSFTLLGVYREPPPAAGDPGPAAEAPAEDAKSTDWRLVGYIVVGVNLFLLVLLLVGWLIYRRRHTPAEVLLDDDEIGV